MFINKIAHQNPPHKYNQDDIRQLMKANIQLSERDARIVDMIYRSSAIQSRYSVIGDLKEGFEGDRLFFDENMHLKKVPATARRNEVYKEHTATLAVALVKDILVQNRLEAQDITHVITVSCTGFYAPGPDFDIVTKLGMKPDTQRYHLGFMGCYAAFPALRMAEAFLAKDPNANVLVVCIELCTIHLQFSDGPDQLLSGALFADGLAGSICTTEAIHADALEWKQSHSTLIGEGEADMAWTIGDLGFDMKLSTYVPKLLEKHAESVIEAAFPDGKPTYDILALHPGGKAIVDRIQEVFGESKESLAYSRKVLQEYGNMSSATIFFVLEDIQQVLKKGQQTLAMGFGPGLTVESALLQKS
jgi:predicted naringenin-chalcone synthase